SGHAILLCGQWHAKDGAIDAAGRCGCPVERYARSWRQQASSGDGDYGGGPDGREEREQRWPEGDDRSFSAAEAAGLSAGNALAQKAKSRASTKNKSRFFAHHPQTYPKELPALWGP